METIDAHRRARRRLAHHKRWGEAGRPKYLVYGITNRRLRLK
jgi:hypothetical protein